MSWLVGSLALIACGPSTIVFQGPGVDGGATPLQDDPDTGTRPDPPPPRAASGDAHPHQVEPRGVEDGGHDPPIVENDGASGCATDPRVDTYAPDLTKIGREKALRFALLESTPAPPSVGSNALRLSIVTSDSASLAGDRKPFRGELRAILTMPDHLHPTTTPPVITFDPATDEYRVDPTYFVMPGVWRVELDAYVASSEGDGALVDDTVYYFCVVSRATPLGPGGL
jgi:hypothetical protein